MSHSKLLLIASLTLASSYALVPRAASAEGLAGEPSIEAYDAREVTLLPRYCIYTPAFRQKIPGANNPAEVKRWSTIMGPIFGAMHHYCWGLMRTNRALYTARTKQARVHHLHASIEEFNYVLNRAPQDFVLLPEILTKKGENLLRLGSTAGLTELQRAIELKPDYWPPYAAGSDYFKTAADLGSAREWLERGLAAAPDAKALQTRLAELDRSKPTARTPAAKPARRNETNDASHR